MERIYTIPVNEAFEKTDMCPFCRLHKTLEDNELELILGASMMEPDVRIQTNALGFCQKHYTRMYNMKNRLGLALMLESHLDEASKKLSSGGIALFKDKLSKIAQAAEQTSSSCYVCSRIDKNFDKMLETACLLWESDSAFRKKLENQDHFCLEHYGMFLKYAKLHISKKAQPDFLKAISAVEEPYMQKIRDNISFFCKKFDYRYADQPWGDAKDAVEKAIRFLEGDNVTL